MAWFSIINITPINNVPLLLGLGEGGDIDQSVRPASDLEIDDLSYRQGHNRIAEYMTY